MFSLSSLAAALPIVAFSTYIIVLNLNNIVQFFCLDRSPTKASFLRRFIDSQICNMQNDSSGIWKERGMCFERFKTTGGSHGRPSQWQILKFVLRELLLKVFRALRGLNVMIPQALRNLGQRRRSQSDKHFLPVSLGQLKEVQVQVQVDVNVERANAVLGLEPSLK